MQSLPFWAEIIGLPLVGLCGNYVVRWALELEPSAAADLILLFALYDGILVIRSDEAFQLSPILSNADAFRSWFVVCIFCNIFIWISTLILLEVKLRPVNSFAPKVNLVKRALCTLMSVVISMLVITYNTVPFTVREVPWLLS